MLLFDTVIKERKLGGVQQWSQLRA
jgi:hypothetical protein